MKKRDSKKGFTIIEVSLVLAIAGLIFLMVFLVLPSVQRTQRDGKRRDDVGVLLAAIQKYQSNNRGALPTDTNETIVWSDSWNDEWRKSQNNTWAGLYYSFLGSGFEDPAGHHYKLKIGDCGVSGTGLKCSFGEEANDDGVSFKANDYTMYIVKSAACNGSEAVASGNLRKVAVLYKMEGTGGAYCANMQ